MLESGAVSGSGGVYWCCYVHFVFLAEGYAVCNRCAANRVGDIPFEVLKGARYEGCCGEKSEDVRGFAPAVLWD